MGKEILWLGGWASDIGCWKDVIQRLYPANTHRFLDALEVLADPERLSQAMEALPPGGKLAAWSMGSLQVHAALASGALKTGAPILSISPIFDFCAEYGPWKPAVVKKMIKKTAAQPGKVLEDFWILAASKSPAAHHYAEAWRNQAGTHSKEALIRGLEYLLGTRVAPAVVLASAPQIRFLASERDPVAPWPGAGALGLLEGDTEPLSPSEDTWAKARMEYPQGHLPFLDYPDRMRGLLEA